MGGRGGEHTKANEWFLRLTILYYHTPNCKPGKWNLLSLCLLNPKISYRHLTEISPRYYGPSPMRTLTQGPSLSPIKGENFYSFLISASLSGIPLILQEWLLMITLINNSEKVVPDFHVSMNASMNLNHFNMSFHCDDFFDKEIKWVKLLIIAWVARGMRLQSAFSRQRDKGFFFHFSCSFTAKFILWLLLRSLFLVLYDKSHYVLRLPKKPPQSSESQLNDGYIRVIFLTKKHLSLGILSGWIPPHGKIVNFAVPISQFLWLA